MYVYMCVGVCMLICVCVCVCVCVFVCVCVCVCVGVGGWVWVWVCYAHSTILICFDQLLGHLLVVAKKVAEIKNLSRGFRVGELHHCVNINAQLGFHFTFDI